MRIRTIKPEFFLHDRLFDAEMEYCLPLRLSFIGLWCAADRSGRFQWEPRRLGACILPYDGVDFGMCLSALAAGGWVRRYEHGGREYGEIPSFRRHQVVNNREKESSIPAPEPLFLDEIDACPTRAPRVTEITLTPLVQDRDAASDAASDAGKAEGKGREGERNGNKTNPVTPREWPRGIDPSRQPSKQVFLDAIKSRFPTWQPRPVSDVYDIWHDNGWRDGNGARIENWQALAAIWYSRADQCDKFEKLPPGSFFPGAGEAVAALNVTGGGEA